MHNIESDLSSLGAWKLRPVERTAFHRLDGTPIRGQLVLA